MNFDKSKFVAREGDSEGFTGSMQNYSSEILNNYIEGRRLDRELANPAGWQEVDGVQLPAISWAEMTDDALEYHFQRWLHNTTAPGQKNAQRDEVRAMLERFNSLQVDGIAELSDKSAPDAYFGWKS